MNMNFSSASRIETTDLPKRQKRKGIRGRSTNETITKRLTIMQKILTDNPDITITDFKVEFKRQCRLNSIEPPGNETIRTDLKKLGYHLREGKVLHKGTELDYSCSSIIQSLFIKSPPKRIYVLVKEDQYLLFPWVKKKKEETENTTEDITSEETEDESVESYDEYYMIISEHIAQNYHSENLVSIYFSFSSGGYESGIAQLFLDALPDFVLSCSTGLRSLNIVTTISNLETVLDFLFEALPPKKDTLYLDEEEQPF